MKNMLTNLSPKVYNHCFPIYCLGLPGKKKDFYCIRTKGLDNKDIRQQFLSIEKR